MEHKDMDQNRELNSDEMAEAVGKIKKKQKRKGSFLISLGLLLILAAIGLSVYNYLDGARAEQASLEIVDQLKTEIEENSSNKGNSENGEGDGGTEIDNPYANLPYVDPDRPMETIEINGYQYIGVVDIPALGLSLPVMAEWDYTRLRISPCRFSGSYYSNDLVIAGHNYARHFSPIKWIDLGTDVYFTNTENVVFHYKVDYVETLRPSQVEDMIAGDWDLTLFTCNTGGQTRCTVRCYRVYN